MVTAPVIQSGIEVNVPETTVVKEVSEEKLVVTIKQDETVYLQNDPVNINLLGAKIRERLPDPTRQSIYLRADKDIPFQTFATVMDALKAVGIENISIVTQPAPRDKK
jgi:biopolymer transport protein ExbD/biopolymer transport protein TolR